MLRKSKQQKNQRQRQSNVLENKPKFVSYYANRQSSEQIKQTNRVDRQQNRSIQNVKWRHIPMLFLAISLIGCLSYISMLGSDAKLLKINREKNLLREIDVYQEYANKILADSIWNKNKLTIDTDKFESKMKQQFPELSRAAVTLPLVGKRPVVELVSEKPVLFLATGNNVYVIDKNGKALAKVSDIKGASDLNIPTLRDEANIKIEPGKGALSEKDVAFITTVIYQFNEKKLQIESLTLPPLASELRVKESGKNYYIKFSLLTDPRIAFGQYFAVKAKLEKDGVNPAEYIDSRVEEKVYYK